MANLCGATAIRWSVPETVARAAHR